MPEHEIGYGGSLIDHKQGERPLLVQVSGIWYLKGGDDALPSHPKIKKRSPMIVNSRRQGKKKTWSSSRVLPEAWVAPPPFPCNAHASSIRKIVKASSHLCATNQDLVDGNVDCSSEPNVSYLLNAPCSSDVVYICSEYLLNLTKYPMAP